MKTPDEIAAREYRRTQDCPNTFDGESLARGFLAGLAHRDATITQCPECGAAYTLADGLTDFQLAQEKFIGELQAQLESRDAEIKFAWLNSKLNAEEVEKLQARCEKLEATINLAIEVENTKQECPWDAGVMLVLLDAQKALVSKGNKVMDKPDVVTFEEHDRQITELIIQRDTFIRAMNLAYEKLAKVEKQNEIYEKALEKISEPWIDTKQSYDQFAREALAAKELTINSNGYDTSKFIKIRMPKGTTK